MAEIVHVVLVEWQDPASGAAEEAERLVRQHLPLIPGVLEVVSGPSVSTEGLEGGFDWSLVVRFADRDAAAAYLPHPDHLPVAQHLGATSTRVVVFDVEAR